MIVGILQPGKSKYEIHSHSQTNLARGLRLRGVTVFEINWDDPDYLKVLTKLRDRDDSVVYLGQLYNLSLNLNGQDRVPIAKWIGRPSVGSLADHPFSAFRLNKIMRMPSCVYLLGREPDYRIALSCIRPDYARFRVAPFVRQVNVTSSRIKSHAERSIDVLVAMDFRSRFPPLEQLITDCTGLGLDNRLPADYFDAAFTDLKTYPFELFDKIFSSLHGTNLQDVSEGQNELFTDLMLILHNLDMMVRGQRRLNLLRELNLAEMPGRIVILTNRTNGLPENPNIEYLGPAKFADYLDLLGDTRLHLFANPTYPNVVNERIGVSLEAGCGVVCDAVPALARFPENEAVIVCRGKTPLTGIAQTISADFDERVRNSRQRIAKYPSSVDVLYDLFQTLLENDTPHSCEAK